jgi:MoaA/NifB/PqqE/SkfB family radical SAM enzyme
MKVNLSPRELHLVRLWWLSCEDMMITEGTCNACEFREECEVIRQKLYGKRSDASSIISNCPVIEQEA